MQQLKTIIYDKIVVIPLFAFPLRFHQWTAVSLQIATAPCCRGSSSPGELVADLSSRGACLTSWLAPHGGPLFSERVKVSHQMIRRLVPISVLAVVNHKLTKDQTHRTFPARSKSCIASSRSPGWPQVYFEMLAVVWSFLIWQSLFGSDIIHTEHMRGVTLHCNK